MGITKIRIPSTPTLGVFISIMFYSWGVTLHIMHLNNNNYVIFLMCIKKSFLLTPKIVLIQSNFMTTSTWGGGGGGVKFVTKPFKFPTRTHTLACSLNRFKKLGSHENVKSITHLFNLQQSLPKSLC